MTSTIRRYRRRSRRLPVSHILDPSRAMRRRCIITQPAGRNHPIPAAWQAGGLAERANCREPGAFPAAPAAALLRSLPTRLGSPWRTSPIAQVGDHRRNASATLSSPAMPSRWPSWAVNCQSASDNHGESRALSDQLSNPFRPTTAGHSHPSIRSRTEEVTDLPRHLEGRRSRTGLPYSPAGHLTAAACNKSGSARPGAWAGEAAIGDD
jgi:hypothetical protein